MFTTQEPRRTLNAVLGALVFVLGAQSIRFLFGSITWYLRDTVGIGTLDLIPIAVAPFILGALIPLAGRWLGPKRATWLGLWLLVIARIVNQVLTDPSIDLWSSAVGTAAFVGLLPLVFSMGRSALVGGVLLGLAVDSAIRGMSLSLDLAYQTGLAPLVGVLGLSLASLYALRAANPPERQGATRTGWTLVGIGPFLFFELLILQNQGWTSEVGGMAAAQAQLRIALLNVLALILVSRFEKSRALVGLALAAMLGAAVAAESGALIFNLFTVLAVPGAGLVWSSLVPDPESRGTAGSTVWLVAGMLLFVVVSLAYYVPMDIDLGFSQSQARLGVAVLLAVFGLSAVLRRPALRTGVASEAWAFAALAAVLPLLGLVTFSTSAPAEESGDGSLRVMAFNIHSSFGTDGTFDIDAIARVIEDARVDIVGLQEVPRGRLLSGVSDQVTLLQQRLGFEHVAFFGTTDPTWGNAILSRYPLSEVEKEKLPLAGTLLRRGYLAATVDTPTGDILFVSIHLQHVNDPAVHDDDPEADLYPVHNAQIGVILDEWGGREPAVMVGDFNARPGWRQVKELLAEGWVDSWDEAGVGQGFTSNAADPKHRIDYIFHTPDLVASDAGVIISQASDHFAVVADLEFR
ncbi:MAG: endonuclease/exonuclease/phosphatase family protein [Acidimicrobiia bacterium]|nr:endonuclease/exonuclease/phosphatase family protein [Acidimicrobiia bacterium]